MGKKRKRIRYSSEAGESEVRIAAARNWFVLLFLPVWLVGWTVGGIMVGLVQIRGGAPDWDGFIYIWLALWLIAAGLALYLWLWNAFGNEVVRIGGSALSLKRDILGLGVRRSFPITGVSNLRAAGLFGSLHSWSYGMAWYGLSPGVVAFEHEGKTHRFGIQLEEQEAHELVEALKRYLPSRAFGATRS